MTDAAILDAIFANVPWRLVSDIVQDWADGTNPVSVRNGVVRVGEGEYQDGTEWFYRGQGLEHGCGRYAARYVEAHARSQLGGYVSISQWKAAVDKRLGKEQP